MTRVLRRGVLVLTGLVAAGLVLAASAAPWLRADLTGMLAGSSDAAVTGADAAPAVPALALVGLAAAAALSIAGRLGRTVAAGAALLAAVGIVAASAQVLARPAAAATPPLARVTSGMDLEPGAVTVTGWPAATIAAGGLLGVVSVLALVRGRRWDAGRRFQSHTRQRTGPGAIDDWDAMTRGADPTAADADRGRG